MISPESRDKKPYALPVQCLPYVGMSEDMIRALANALIGEMTTRGMKVVGEVYQHSLTSCYMFTVIAHGYYRMYTDHTPLVLTHFKFYTCRYGD